MCFLKVSTREKGKRELKKDEFFLEGLISQFVWGDITFLKSYVHPYSYYKLDFKSCSLRFGKNFKFSISFTMCEV